MLPRPPSKLQVGRAAGFTMIEVLVVVAVICVLAAVVAVAYPRMATDAKADGEMQRVMAALRRGREAAIAQRRNVVLEFPTATQVRLVRQDVANGVVVGTTEMALFDLAGDFRMLLFPGVPDTPDAFGNDVAASFGGAVSMMFTTEGALVDQTGDPVNGTVFIGRPGQAASARAITVLGATGLVGGWRWSGDRWMR